jgi:hypothetical protein
VVCDTVTPGFKRGDEKARHARKALPIRHRGKSKEHRPRIACSALVREAGLGVSPGWRDTGVQRGREVIHRTQKRKQLDCPRCRKGIRTIRHNEFI